MRRSQSGRREGIGINLSAKKASAQPPDCEKTFCVLVIQPPPLSVSQAHETTTIPRASVYPPSINLFHKTSSPHHQNLASNRSNMGGGVALVSKNDKVLKSYESGAHILFNLLIISLSLSSLVPRARCPAPTSQPPTPPDTCSISTALFHVCNVLLRTLPQH